MNTIIDLKRVIDLGGELVTLDEAKKQLVITYPDDDTFITGLIPKARRYLENYLNISIVYQRIQLIAYLEGEWKLPYGPVIGLESVGTASGPTGSAPVSYTGVDNWGVDGDLFIPSGVWGYDIFRDRLNTDCGPAYSGIRHKIIYTAGNFCPDDLKDTMLQVITFLYENRGSKTDVNKLTEVMSNADQYKVVLWV